MLNKYILILCFGFIVGLFSCQNKQTKVDIAGSDSLLQVVDIDATDNIDIENLLNDSSSFAYLIADHFDDKDSITKLYPSVEKRKWHVLTYFVDQRKFYYTPIQLDTTNWLDACNGVDMTTIQNVKKKTQTDADTEYTSEPNEIDYIYLSNLNRAEGEVPSIFHTQLSVVPGSPYTFDYNGKQYTLRAEGTLAEYASLPNPKSENYMGRFYNYVDGYDKYNLYLEADGITQLLNTGGYQSTCLEIYFIGDLDNDGKPDFLFQTNTWYEGSEVTLFLSSKAGQGQLVKNMGVSGNYYSC